MSAFLRKYGTGTGADLYIPMVKRGVVDFALSADWTPAAGDVKVSKDGAAAANIGTLPTAVTMGNTAMWKFVFTDAELQCATLAVFIADSATKAVEDQAFVIETYGHASAMHAFDFDTAVQSVNTTQWGGTAVASANVRANLVQILGTAPTEGGAGRLAAAFTTLLDVATPVFTAASVNQTGDSYGRIGANGAGLTALAPASTALSTATWTNVRAGYLDNLNIGGAVAGSSEVTGLNVNTRANLSLPLEIETPDSSTLVYKVRLHLFDSTGDMEAPDSTPTVALTNAAGTDRSSRVSAASNPSAGVYTWDYTATAGDAEEQLVWVFTVVEGGITRTYSAMSYVVEQSAYRFSSSDRTKLNAIHAKLPTKTYIVGTENSDGDVQLNEATGVLPAGSIDANTLADGLITAAKLAANAITAAKAAADLCNKIADHVRRRTQANTEASSDGDALSVGSEYGNIQMAQESNTTATPGSLTIFKTDGTTVLGTKAITTNASADPITGVS